MSLGYALKYNKNMSDLVKLYNPANAALLKPEEIQGLQNLTSAEIKELAIAYPNMTMQRSYLLIIDSSKSEKKQIPALSTFENLWNLRERNGLKNYVAYQFYGTYKSKIISPARVAQRSVVHDLSDTELMSLPGFKTATKTEKPQEVKVTKIKKLFEPKIGEGGISEIIKVPAGSFLDLSKEKPALAEIKIVVPPKTKKSKSE